ncbi:Protein of unknown function DUF58 [Nitrosomonas sp. Nm51]|uniref:DUF58 domain-containing protein n=1 Tax=Nitrosomonas sp. Nm51 TaxID=133720 RepID=UPI0008BA40D8|nr:DUF58 domain-containing protein [Nitrosomonas sp. Nm51]SER07039.1 Protein of unknown function DUF58 [Nitrosomonas sp. Nm51]
MSEGTALELNTLIRLRATARSLELGARRRALSAQAGGYLSVYHGRGMEFDEVRAYQAGDDVRTIDWRVTARRGRVHTKLFREERERPVLFLVDLHPGMYFGSRVQYKSVLAGRLSAVLGWAAVSAGDRVGGIVQAAGRHREIYPAAHEAGLLPMLQAMVQLQPTGPGELVNGRLDGALARMARIALPGSMIVIFSDFRELGNNAEKYLSALARHNDVISALLYDPLEAAPPPAGLYRLGVNQQRVTADTSRASVIEQWQAQFKLHREKIRGICTRHAAHFMEIATTDRMVPALRSGLARHKKNR